MREDDVVLEQNATAALKKIQLDGRAGRICSKLSHSILARRAISVGIEARVGLNPFSLRKREEVGSPPLKTHPE